MRKFILFLFAACTTMVFAQVTTVPGIIQKGFDGEITIIYNPNEGNGGMADATKCYAHTGITLDGKAWQKASSWRDGKEKYKMTKNADGNWELKITPNIYEYYGVPDTSDISQMCFVFNDGPNGELEGKTAEGGDIFVDLADAGLAVLLVSSMPEISEIGDQVTLNCYALNAEKMTLFLNGNELQTTTQSEMVYTYTFEAQGDYNFELVATKGAETKKAVAKTWIPMLPVKANRPEGIVNGIYYDEEDNTKVTLCTYAGAKLTIAPEEAKEITVRAKMPSHWTNTISAYTWTPNGNDGKFITPERDGEWYVVKKTATELYVIFVNGTSWNGDLNQTEDIVVRSNTNIQITQSGSSKAKYTVLGSDVTVRAKMPSNWTEKITALVTPLGGSEKVVVPELKDGWYVFTETCKEMSVVYRNGVANGDSNHSEPITLSENVILNLTQEGDAKAVCNILIADPAKHVFVVGDFNNWIISDEYQLKQANDSAYFWIELTGLEPQKEYAMQYVVVRADGEVKRISDLYSEKVLHPDDKYEPKTVDPSLMDYPAEGDGYVTVIQTAKPAFEWSDATLNFQRPDKNNLIIYELWVYDYTPERSLAAVTERLDYLVSLGVNAIELMPVTEFDGNYNWGYSPNHYFAFDKAYGSPEDLKMFVDSCHKHGIAVIVDMVFNHATGLNPMNKLYPYGEELVHNPWFNVNPPHSDNVYEDWNHDFAPTKTMFTRALQYWLKEYKVDGFRMDLSHGLCGTTNNAMEHIADYYNEGVKAVEEDAYFILEHWGANMGSDRPALINQGMLCWQNTNEDYRNTAAGYTSRGFTNANKRGYVSYCESHDEERMQYHAMKSGVGDIKTNTTTRLNRVAVNVVFNVLLGGPHMIWQFEEIGYDFSINSSEGSPNSTSSDNRCAKKPRPESKGYFADPVRRQQFVKIAQAIHLRTKILSDKFVEHGKPTKVDIGAKALRTIQWGSDVYVAGNFHASQNQTVEIPQGTWYNYYAQVQQTERSITLAPGEFIILTGSPIEKPMIQNNLTDVEDLLVDTTVDMLPPYNVNIYSINGQLINSQKNVMEADLTGMNAGLYIVQYEKNGNHIAKKVIR